MNSDGAAINVTAIFFEGKLVAAYIFQVVMTSRLRVELLATPCILYSYRVLSGGKAVGTDNALPERDQS
jgi:hypothetical protein